MKKIIIMAITAIALCAGSAVAKDIQKVVLTTNPEMHCQNCEAKIKDHLKSEKGVKKIETSVKDQTVTITYDADKTSENAIMDAFSKIKYEVKKVDPSAPEAPAKCGRCSGNGCSSNGSCH